MLRRKILPISFHFCFGDRRDQIHFATKHLLLSRILFSVQLQRKLVRERGLRIFSNLSSNLRFVIVGKIDNHRIIRKNTFTLSSLNQMPYPSQSRMIDDDGVPRLIFERIDKRLFRPPRF